jgi:hypothetical protein
MASAAAKVVPIRPAPQPDELDAAYRATASLHYPNSDEMTLAIRVEIMRLRDQAAAGLRVCGESSAPILAEITRIGGIAALAGAPTRSLAFVRIALESMMFSARLLERSGL